jgi:hypothetical protein
MKPLLFTKYETEIKRASLHLLEKGFSILTDKEIELERQLNEIREAKARFLIEIDSRIKLI